jgi:hypothetical protein
MGGVQLCLCFKKICMLSLVQETFSYIYSVPQFPISNLDTVSIFGRALMQPLVNETIQTLALHDTECRHEQNIGTRADGTS